MIAFNKYKSILCLDGVLPPADFFQQLALPIIAADGAANKLMQINIQPQLVVGDLDSLDPLLLAQLKTLHVPDQNECDYQKALAYLRQENLLPTIVCGINGGSLDHILNNISIFMQSENLLYTSEVIGWVMGGGEAKSIRLPQQTKISLLGIPNAVVSSRGLQWELNNYHMQFPGRNSCFNRSVQDEVEITVHEGEVLVLVHR